LVFVANGEIVAQEFTLTRMSTRVGGDKWLLKCPETHEMVQDLFLAAGEQRFRSRHALKLVYSSKSRNAWERHWQRCLKLMNRIGADHYRLR
jgi:hypothetical protein